MLSLDRMVRVKKDMNVSAMGKPTEKTSAPTAPAHHSGYVMDGIVRGVSKGTKTAVVDGLIRGASLSGAMESPTLRQTVPLAGKSATKYAEQNFGAVPYAMSAYGRRM